MPRAKVQDRMPETQKALCPEIAETAGSEEPRGPHTLDLASRGSSSSRLGLDLRV
jgi:hypothetical protein